MLPFLLLATVFCLPLNLYPLRDFPKDFLGLSLVVICSSVVIWTNARKLRFSKSLIWVFLFGFVFLLSEVLGSAASNNPFVQFYMFWGVASVLLLIALPTVVNQLGYDRFVKQTFYTLSAVGSAVAVIALFRHYGLLGEVLPWLSAPQSRLAGPWGQANLTAVILAIGMVATSRVLFEFESLNWVGIATWLGLISIGYAGYLTLSRSWLVFVGVWLAVLMILSFVLARDSSKYTGLQKISLRKIGLMSGSLILLFFLSGPIDYQIQENLRGSGEETPSPSFDGLPVRTDQSSVDARLYEWQKGFSNFASIDSILFGHGLGRYGNFSYSIEQKDAFSGTRTERLWSHAHNLFLHSLIEWGLLGLFLLVISLAVLLYRLKNLPFNIDYLSITAMILIILAHNLVEFSLWYFPIFTLFLVLIALVVSDAPIADTSAGKLPRMLVTLVLIVLIPIGARAATDYYQLTTAFNSDTLAQQDQHNLNMIKSSPLFSAEAYKVDILRIKPAKAGANGNLELLAQIKEVRPEPLIVMRHTVLSTLDGETADACDRVRKMVRTFPFLHSILVEELEYLKIRGADIPIQTFDICSKLGLSQRLIVSGSG